MAHFFCAVQSFLPFHTYFGEMVHTISETNPRASSTCAVFFDWPVPEQKKNYFIFYWN